MEKKYLEMAITKDIEQLKNTKIQEMEELIELKSRKEEARVELDRIKEQIEEEKAKLERIQASMAAASPLASPASQSAQTSPPLLSPTSGLLRPSLPASADLPRSSIQASCARASGSENLVTAPPLGSLEKVCRPAPRILNSKSVPTAAQQQEGSCRQAATVSAASFQTNFSAFLPVPTTATSGGEKRSYQQMAGSLLEQEILRPGFRPTGQRPGHSQPAIKAFRSASAEEKESQKSGVKSQTLPTRMTGGAFQKAPWSHLASMGRASSKQVLDPYIPTPVVGIERFAAVSNSRQVEEQQANELRQASRMSRQGNSLSIADDNIYKSGNREHHPPLGPEERAVRRQQLPRQGGQRNSFGDGTTDRSRPWTWDTPSTKILSGKSRKKFLIFVNCRLFSNLIAHIRRQGEEVVG